MRVGGIGPSCLWEWVGLVHIVCGNGHDWSIVSLGVTGIGQ